MDIFSPKNNIKTTKNKLNCDNFGFLNCDAFPSSDVITSLCGYMYLSVSETWKVILYLNGGGRTIWNDSKVSFLAFIEWTTSFYCVYFWVSV